MTRQIVLVNIGGGLALSGVLPSVEMGADYSARVTARGGRAPYTYTITAGGAALASAGIYLDPATGEFTGNAAALGDYPITVRGTDITGRWTQRRYVVSVIGAAEAPPEPDGDMLNFLSTNATSTADGYGDLGVAFEQDIGVIGWDDYYPEMTISMPVRNLTRDGVAGVVKDLRYEVTLEGSTLSDDDINNWWLAGTLAITVTSGGATIFSQSDIPLQTNPPVRDGDDSLTIVEYIGWGTLTYNFLTLMDALSTLPEFDAGTLTITQYIDEDEYDNFAAKFGTIRDIRVILARTAP